MLYYFTIDKIKKNIKKMIKKKEKDDNILTYIKKNYKLKNENKILQYKISKVAKYIKICY